MQNNVLKVADLANPAGAITGSRLLIAIGFPFLAYEPTLALTAYLVAVLTDVLDGVTARHLGQSSHTGAVLDGWVDKILHINAAWSMTLHGYMPAWWMWMWFSREIFQWSMVMTIIGDFRVGHVRQQATSIAGRATAVALFASFVLTLMGQVHIAWPMTVLTGACGTWAGSGYLRRHLEDRRRFR
jgi:phosphatidylglycerophosphate synthase